MSKTFNKLLATRSWVAHIDDERGDGNGIIVTLRKDYVWDDERDCGVRGFDSVKEVELFTRKSDVFCVSSSK